MAYDASGGHERCRQYSRAAHEGMLTMTMWEPPSKADPRYAEQRAIEEHAAHDAFTNWRRIWNSDIPNGELAPVATHYTYRYIARRRQESAALPRWTFASPDAMHDYIQWVGDRYYDAFLRALKEYFSVEMNKGGHVPPRTTPRLRSFHASADSEPSYPTPEPPQHDAKGA